MVVYLYIYVPVVPARGGAEVALKIYIRPFSSIELACAVRQPSPCVRALSKLLSCSVVVQDDLRDPGAMQRQAKTFLTLHAALFTLQTGHFISSQIM